MGKEIGRYFKYNWSKISTPTLTDHTSSASNLTPTFISYHLDNKDSTKIQNKNNTSNIDDIHSCLTPQKKYIFQTTSTPPRLTPLNTTLPVSPVELHTTTKLNPVGK